ncbi:CENP-C_C domain-containing protein [Trichonephila inaurata madagascariensis]|uniref:CENP-C_C domain-containing protein n=1 Tax=Trichonephila inaurata madagascariensis TaxID=2747483 RepID=A0A8X6WWV6_9ARAC|nr:CENP-C_C domain-containing protein [Trichonephila inaurata madagascariensis]
MQEEAPSPSLYERLKITKMKGRRKPESNIDRRRSLKNRPQEEGTHELSTLLPDQMDERVAEARELSPKKRPLSQKDLMSFVKKTKKIKSSEVSSLVADASKSRRHSSVASLPVIECPQKKKSLPNVNKALNTSVKRHKKSTPKNEMYVESAKQPLNKKNREIQSPVTTVVTNDEAVRESHGDALDIRESSPFLPDLKEKKVSKRREWTSDTFSGSAKDIKRVVTQKIPRPSSNVVITTAKIPNEEGQLRIKPSDSKKKIRVSKTGTGLFQFKNQPYNNSEPETIQESIKMPEREPKKDETSKNISNNIQQNQRNYTESDSDTSTVENYPFMHRNGYVTSKSDSDTSTVEDYSLTHTSKYVTSKSDQHTRLLSPKNQNHNGNNDFSEVHMSSVKKTKKRRLRIISNYDEAPRREKSPSKPELSPVMKGRSTISGQEKSPYKTSRRITPTFIKSLRQEKSPLKPEESPVLKGRPRMLKESSIEEKSPVPKERPRMPKEASIEEKSPTKPGHSPVTRGRSTTSIEAPSKPEHSRVTRGRSRTSVYHLTPLNSSVVTNEEAMRESHGDALDIHGRTFKKNKPDPRDKRVSKRRERTSDSFSGCAKDIKRVSPKIPRPSSNLVITTAENRKEERPLRIKPCSVIMKKIHVSKTGTGPFQPCIDYGPDTIDESVEIPERESKKDETSKNILKKLNWNAVLSDSTKDTRQIIQNQRNYAESDSDASTVEYTLTHASKYVTSKSDQHTGLLSPKNQNDMGNNDFSEVHMSPVKKTKKRNSRIISDYDEASRREKSPSKPELSPVMRERSTISGQEKSPYKTTRIITPTFIKSLRQEKSPSKPEESSVPKGRPRMPKESSIEEKSPSKPKESPVQKGRPKMPKEASIEEKSSVKRKRPRGTVEHFEPEESPSESEQSPIKKKRTLTPSGFSQKKSSKIRPSRNENNNEEGPLRINPSVTKRHVDSSVKMSQKQAYQTLYNAQVEYVSPRTSPVKSKSSMATYDITHRNHLGPEASIIVSETSPKKITQGTGDQLNHSGQKNLSAKAKASKNKMAAPIDNNEVQSDFGENSMSIVKRKENKMTVSSKNNRHPHSEKSSKSPNCRTQDIISNENTSGQANGLRRSCRFRVPPLDIWRNERLVFEKLPSGEIQCKIDKGTEADNSGINSFLRKQARRMKPPPKKTKNITNTPILDIKTGEVVHTLVHRPFESLQWAIPPNEEAYQLTKTFTSKSKSFGFIDVFPFSTKEKQYSPDYNLHFVVVKGHLEVTIQDTSFTFSVGDSWIVPVGVPYSVTNCSRVKALLSFSAFKEE